MRPLGAFTSHSPPNFSNVKVSGKMVSAIPVNSEVNVLFGTQTGNAGEIARRIASELAAAGRNVPPARSLAEFAALPAFGDARAPSTVVIVSSTTGDGDPPDAIRPFMRFLRKAAKNPSSLSHISYALLGLGDTNYENFCNAAKKIDVALIGAGASAFTPRGLADDGTGLESVVEPWIEKLYAALDVQLGPVSSLQAVEIEPPRSAVQVEQSQENAGSESRSQLFKEKEQRLHDPQMGKLSEYEDAEMAALIKGVTVTELGFDEKDLPKVLPLSIRADKVDINHAQDVPAPLSNVEVSPYFIQSSAIHGRVTGARKLTSTDAVKAVYHIEVDCSHSAVALEYSPGDAFGIIVGNMDNEVNRLLATARISPDDVFAIQRIDEHGPIDSNVIRGTARTLVKYRVDLRAIPKRTLIRSLAEHCNNIAENKSLLQLCSKKGRKDYVAQIVDPGLSVLDILERIAPSCHPPLALLLDLLPPLAPRYYSAASTPEVDEKCLHFAFSVVPNGLATTFLANCCELFLNDQTRGEAPQIVLIPRPSDSTTVFRPPSQLETSYIMIGPGTGVAPFRGFLRQRQFQLGMADKEQEKIGETMLFFGCRNRSKDFLYGAELEKLQTESTLSVLDIAFSRDSPSVVYVQDRLRERGSDVWAALEAGAIVYVCGDGGGMAAGVDSALRDIVAKHLCNGSAAETAIYMNSLVANHRYIRDIWFFGNVSED